MADGAPGHVHRDDEPPESVRTAALRAFDQRVPGARIADAIYDSWVVEPAGVAQPGPRVLRFACPGRVVEVGVFPRPDGVALRLRTTPPGTVQVEVRQRAASVAFVTDADGILEVHPGPTGVLCFVLRAEGDPVPVQTAWLRI